MSEFISSLYKILLTPINLNLVTLLGLIHSYRGVQDESHPLELLFIFESNFQIRIKCHQDGESIFVDNKGLVETNLEEYGKNEIRNLSKSGKTSAVVGKKLLDIDLVVSSDLIVFGVVFVFEENLTLVVLNLGDDLYVYDELPNEIIKEENAQLKRIN